MGLLKVILTEIGLSILVGSIYALLSIGLVTGILLNGILITYAYLTLFFRIAVHAILFRCIHWIFVPTALLAVMTIYWIESQKLDVGGAILLCWVKLKVKLDKIWTVILDTEAYPICIQQAIGFIRDYNMSFMRTNLQAVKEGTGEDTHEEPSTIKLVARVRNREEDRLHNYIQDLEALEASNSLGGMTAEQAILLILTRTAVASGRGLIYYRLLEEHSKDGNIHLAVTRQHAIMVPHSSYHRLYKSSINLFRPDESDCPICYCPLEVGESMITHETCRRTFHTTCFDSLLVRERICPFDREHLVRHEAHGLASPLEQLRNAAIWPEQIRDDPVPVPAPLDIPRQRPQNQDEQPVPAIQEEAAARHARQEEFVLAAQVRARRQLREMQELLEEDEGPQEDARPASDRLHRNNFRGRGAPRRAWR